MKNQARLAGVIAAVIFCLGSAMGQKEKAANQPPQTPSPLPQTINLYSYTTTAPVSSSSEEKQAPAQPQTPVAICVTTVPAAQTPVMPDTPALSKADKKKKNKEKLHVHPFSTLALGIKAGTLGGGAEAAVPLSRALNLRATVNFVNWGQSFRIDGINYFTKVDFRSAQASIDWFPFHGGFHISPGYMYFKNQLAGVASVPAGQPFSLGSTHYINSVDDPVGGTASVTFSRNLAPTLTIGFSNVIPRTGKHFTMPFEIGAAYTKPAYMDVKLLGTACTEQGCFNAGIDPDTQANLQSEIKDLNKQMKNIPIFPIVSLGMSLRF